MEASPVEAIDVNTPADFELAQFVASGQREKERITLRTLRTELSSPVLSDILDELGIDGVVRGIKPLIVTAIKQRRCIAPPRESSSAKHAIPRVPRYTKPALTRASTRDDLRTHEAHPCPSGETLTFKWTDHS